jgi:hypothetical protein
VSFLNFIVSPQQNNSSVYLSAFLSEILVLQFCEFPRQTVQYVAVSTVPALSLSNKRPNYIKLVTSNNWLKSVSINKTLVSSNLFINVRQRCVCSCAQRELANYDGKCPHPHTHTHTLQDCNVTGVLASRATGFYTSVAG